MPPATFSRQPSPLPQAVIDALHCPMCQRDLVPTAGALHCAAGHTFNVARQGYVNLLTGGMRSSTADSVEMVQAREEFLGAGHYSGVAALLADAAARFALSGGLLIDAGAGTGYHLQAVLERLPSAVGLALDLSAPAQRRAARAHPRIGGVVWDTWRPWPVRSGAATVVINVFAPRNGAEFRRVLRDDGVLLVVTPAADHLAEVVAAAGALTVDRRKDERLEASLVPHFYLHERQEYRTQLFLDAADVQRLLQMGPSAHHHAGRSGPAEHPTTATVSVVLSVYCPL